MLGGHDAASVVAWFAESHPYSTCRCLVPRGHGRRVDRAIQWADRYLVGAVPVDAGQNQNGVVIMLTIGTGIGSAIFLDGKLVPNTELGHLQIQGMDAEHRASDRIRKEEDLSWKEWGKRLNEYLQHVEFLFSPDLFIIGGGVSKKHDKFFKHLELQTPIVPAELRNEAGIIGAAMAARDLV